MSRQKGVDVQYAHPKVIITVSTVIIFFTIVILTLYIKFNPANDPRNELPAGNTPTPTQIPYQNLDTPTPFPTLTETQRKELIDEIERLPISVPPEALPELRNTPKD